MLQKFMNCGFFKFEEVNQCSFPGRMELLRPMGGLIWMSKDGIKNLECQVEVLKKQRKLQPRISTQRNYRFSFVLFCSDNNQNRNSYCPIGGGMNFGGLTWCFQQLTHICHVSWVHVLRNSVRSKHVRLLMAAWSDGTWNMERVFSHEKINAIVMQSVVTPCQS